VGGRAASCIGQGLIGLRFNSFWQQVLVHGFFGMQVLWLLLFCIHARFFVFASHVADWIESDGGVCVMVVVGFMVTLVV
jgi:Fe2+ transport system protein B